MKKIATLLTLILALSIIFCSCTAGTTEETTQAENTTIAPVFEEDTHETENVFAEQQSDEAVEETVSQQDEEATFSVG